VLNYIKYIIKQNAKGGGGHLLIENFIILNHVI